MEKLNKFYIFMSILILILGLILIFSVKTVISAFTTANQIEQGESLVSVDDKGMDEVYTWSFDRETIELNIESSITETDIDDE